MGAAETKTNAGVDSMTHEELLAKIDHMWNDDFDYVIEQNRKALRAVVELHKPVKENETETYCFDCQIDEYPCATIQAIEKELN